jgi:hypothetical protein
MFSIFFIVMDKSIDPKLQQKICTKSFHIPFYDFFVIYYDFSKLLQGVICPILES